MKYLFAKRTATDCFIQIEDEAGAHTYARAVVIQGPSIMFSKPTRKGDGSEFRTAGVYVLTTDEAACVTIPCDADGVRT